MIELDQHLGKAKNEGIVVGGGHRASIVTEVYRLANLTKVVEVVLPFITLMRIIAVPDRWCRSPFERDPETERLLISPAGRGE